MTETALAVREDFKITAGDVKKYFAPNATEKEFGILMGICKSFNLNPFKREVHFVKYGNAPASVITGYEIYLKRAERTGKLDGWKCWIERDDIGEKAVIEIKRKDQSIPVRWEVYRKEFDKGQSTWKSMPMFMLKKVAIAQGFRLAFSDDLGGLPYIPEEMPQDKGGGVSESLPQEVIEVADAPPDVPEPPLLEPPADLFMESGSPIHKKIEVLIQEAKINRDIFKVWLVEIKKISIKDDRPSLSTMSAEDAKSMVDKWPKVVETFSKWRKKQGGE